MIQKHKLSLDLQMSSFHRHDIPKTIKESLTQVSKRIFQSALTSLSVGLAVTAVSADTTGTQLQEAEKSQAPVFNVTSSGLQFYDIKEGDGESPAPGDTVRVHYTGWLEGFNSEKKFDSSYDRRSPLVFKAGVRQVIAGWDEALLTNFKVGGKRNVIIPPELGYGSRGAGGVIPPNATLYFTMELVGIGNKANR
jgi:peptidylprolyl isomerase